MGSPGGILMSIAVRRDRGVDDRSKRVTFFGRQGAARRTAGVHLLHAVEDLGNRLAIELHANIEASFMGTQVA